MLMVSPVQSVLTTAIESLKNRGLQLSLGAGGLRESKRWLSELMTVQYLSCRYDTR